MFEHLADLNTLCFLGTRLDEPYLQATLLRLPSSHPRHVLVTDDATLDEIAQPARRGALLPLRYGIVTCSFGKDRSLLAGFCRQLADRAPPHMVELPKATPELSPFVEPVIGLRTTTGSKEVAMLMNLAFPDQDTVAQSAVVRAWRALITAPAGSGKSTVLRRIAAQQPGTERPIIIELHRLHQLRGSPDVLLKSWIGHGEGVGDTELDLEARLFLLLDGFDEIDAPRQQEAAETIVALGGAFPQHRLLVTSRRVPAVETLLHGGFTEFALWTTRITAERFLWARGTTVQRLRHRLPHFHHLGPLTTNPLILDALIEMADHVPSDLSPFACLIWMLESIAERLCQRESHRLAYTPAELRRAISAVASVLEFFDLRAVAIESLHDLGDPLLNNVAMSRQLLRDAALRLLSISEREETFAFPSSALSAFLAADHILGADHTATKALSAVMPAISHDIRINSPKVGGERMVHVEHSGIRSDLYELASILAARSDSWADALWTADPLLVASVASANCVRPSLHMRARKLWRAIREGVRWRTTQDDVSGARLFPGYKWLPEPEIALGALLREHHFPRLERELVAAALSTEDAAGPALVAMAMTGRLAPRTLSRIVRRVHLSNIGFVVRAIRISGRRDLLGSILEQQLAHTAVLRSTVLDDVGYMIAEHQAGATVVGALARYSRTPNHLGKLFWDLVGVVRISGSSDDVARLWNMLLTTHREAFALYAADHWLVLLHLLVPLYSEDTDGTTLRLSTEGYQAVQDFVTSLEGQISPASLTLEEAMAQSSGFITTERKAPESSQPEEHPAIPMLLPRCKLQRIVERMTLDLSPSDVDYSSFVPNPEQLVSRMYEHTAAPVEQDPIVVINEYLAASSPDFSDLDAVLEGVETLDAWSRHRIGIRLEEAVPMLAPGSESSRRLDFLRRWGLALGLPPLEDEWLLLARHKADSDYLSLHPPPLTYLRQALRGVSDVATAVPALLSSAPVGWRMLLLDDAIAVLTSVVPTQAVVLEVCSAIAHSSRSADGIERLRKTFPQFADELAGWAAARGDREALIPAFTSILNAAHENDEAHIFRSGTVDWFEDALEQLSPGTLDPMSVLSALPFALFFGGGGAAAHALAELLGVLSIANAPVMTATTLAMLCLVNGSEGVYEDFKVIRDAAVDGAHRDAGVQAAERLFGTTRNTVLGRRNLSDIDLVWRAQDRRRAT